MFNAKIELINHLNSVKKSLTNDEYIYFTSLINKLGDVDINWKQALKMGLYKNIIIHYGDIAYKSDVKNLTEEELCQICEIGLIENLEIRPNDKYDIDDKLKEKIYNFFLSVNFNK